jgi:Kef-type K+ transport system membrane component KefB
MAGAFIGGRLTGLTVRESSALALLMNARGLVGLIIFNIGLDAGLISTSLFTILVLMDLVTTVMTGPLLRLVAHTAAWGLAQDGA